MALLGDKPPCALNVVLRRAAFANPDGDAIECDVLTGAANDVLHSLRDLGLERHGSVVLDPVDTVFSEHAARTGAQRLGATPRAPVWAQVEARIRAEGRYPRASTSSWSSRGSSARSASSPTPDPDRRRHGGRDRVRGHRQASPSRSTTAPGRIRQGLMACSWASRWPSPRPSSSRCSSGASGFRPRAFELGVRPVSNLINTPNFFSVVVAVLAGVVGIVSLAEARPRYCLRRLHLGDHRPGRGGHRGLVRVRQLGQGLGVAAPTPAQHRRIDRGRDRHAQVPAGDLAAGGRTPAPARGQADGVGADGAGDGVEQAQRGRRGRRCPGTRGSRRRPARSPRSTPRPTWSGNSR